MTQMVWLISYSQSSGLGSITMNKASEGDGIPVKLFKILKDDAFKVLHSISANLENSTVATVLEKDHFHFNPKQGQCQTVVLEKTLEESLGQQGDQTSQSQRKSTLKIHWKDWCWSWSTSALATWCKEPTYWKKPWCLQRLRAREEGGDRGCNG